MNEKQAHYCGVIAEHYGRRKQEVQAVQELSELICVLTRRPDQRGETYAQALADEIADCEIMIEQIRRLHCIKREEIERRIYSKIDRQLKIISQEKRTEENT